MRGGVRLCFRSCYAPVVKTKVTPVMDFRAARGLRWRVDEPNKRSNLCFLPELQLL